jgi:maltose alpha-D-glucosyltransferase / alpha-amylase
MPESDPLWYKDAVFYELHVKAFQDSNADGAGDFRGLVERLDYVRDLGVDCIWLLPFYPSPLRDDGYDIADYYGVHPAYGTLDDFERFMEEAHKRELRVIADLVLNHTSSDHPWFQRARRAPRGSPERDFYVWSDSDERYREARIIFTDTEPSNWTWDPIAGQYFWHRFFSHQPDLNWDNPEVKEKMFEVMEFWLDRGLDGFRADAVPYLIEREGTNCENLPETHEILKEFRTRLDTRYPGRVLLAEANQWPDDVRPYFGDGDEFHMAFHFPLMPRIFMAVRQGIRRPIVEIIQQTPEIPSDCQWCMFLRNHDELTLEMVTDEERDYLYQEYANDPRMRLNLGIRRRLAPLMDNDRRKIELLNSILFTMPGSPVIYYGDEMAMGDNIWLGDRDGVRTPMQWSPDRNAGFSRAESARLYAPIITDSVYGFQAVNVEAQEKSPFSLLNWMKRLIQVRKEHRALGRGTIEFLRPPNPHVLAYVREYDGDSILVVQNVSGAAQAVQLDLSRFSGRTPVELLGHTAFLPIDESPYALTLGPYGFFWFGLRAAVGAEEEAPWPAEWAEQEMAAFESAPTLGTMIASLPHEWLVRQRWFRSKAREIAALDLEDRVILAPEQGQRMLVTLVRVEFASNESETYLLPFTFSPPDGATAAEPVTTHIGAAGEVSLYEALVGRHTSRALLDIIEQEAAIRANCGMFRGRHTAALAAAEGDRKPVRRVEGEQSNTSVIFGNQLILKLFRKLEPGMNPDIEISRFLLEETEFDELPALAGWIEYDGDEGWNASVAALFQFVENGGDAWGYTHRALKRYFAAASRTAADPATTAGREAARRMAGDFGASAGELGRVTGRLHVALASAGPEHADFAPEPVSAEDVTSWGDQFRSDSDRVFTEVGQRLEAMPGFFPRRHLNEILAVVRAASDIADRSADLSLLERAGSVKTRYHGDLHLGQVLRAAEASPGRSREWLILDFEGEPARPIHERRTKHSPSRDVAGMLRSFNYAVQMALAEFEEQGSGATTGRAPLEAWADAWEREIRELFLVGYLEEAAGSAFLPAEREALDRILAVFELEKAIYELGYEMNNRPDWIWLPVLGIRRILGGDA